MRIAVFLSMLVLLGPLSGCFGTSEVSVTDNTSIVDDASFDENITNVGNEDDQPTPVFSPYDVVCPDGTNETIQWGSVTCAAPVAFKAADVSNETLNLTLEWYNIASAEWGNFGPVELFIVGEDVEAAVDLEGRDLPRARPQVTDELRPSARRGVEALDAPAGHERARRLRRPLPADEEGHLSDLDELRANPRGGRRCAGDPSARGEVEAERILEDRAVLPHAAHEVVAISDEGRREVAAWRRQLRAAGLEPLAARCAASNAQGCTTVPTRLLDGVPHGEPSAEEPQRVTMLHQTKPRLAIVERRSWSPVVKLEVVDERGGHRVSRCRSLRRVLNRVPR